jgi:hypothetical protein
VAPGAGVIATGSRACTSTIRPPRSCCRTRCTATTGCSLAATSSSACWASWASTRPWAETINRLRCLRGIDTLSAVGLIAEIGDFERFCHPRKLAGFLGLVPSEDTSGEVRRQGSITKAGSKHARRLLVEAAWHHRNPPRISKDLERRQRGQDPRVIDAAWRCQRRLYQRWQRLDTERGKRRTLVAVAVARELSSYCWELATL